MIFHKHSGISDIGLMKLYAIRGRSGFCARAFGDGLHKAVQGVDAMVKLPAEALYVHGGM